MKFAKICWSAGSILVNVTIVIYIVLQSKAPSDIANRMAYINENWDSYGAHWKAEFLFMTSIAIGAIYFAVHFRRIEWIIIAVGQLILLLTYPLMLGGYPNTSLEMAQAINQIATVTFVFGNVVFLGGLVYLYSNDTMLNPILKYVALAAASIALITFSIIFAGFVTWDQAIIVGPLVNILYLINAYHGYKLD